MTIMVAMARQDSLQRLVIDRLWKLLHPLISQHSPTMIEEILRPRNAGRAALKGILFVTETGNAMKKLPTELRSVGESLAGDACKQEAGVCHHALLQWLT